MQEQVSKIVTRAFDRFGYFAVQAEKLKLFDIIVRIVVSVSDNLDKADISVVREDILKSIFTLGLDNNRLETILRLVFEEIEQELVREEVRDREVFLAYRRYAELVLGAVREYEKLFVSDISDHLDSIYTVTSSSGGGYPVRFDVVKSGRLGARFADIFKSRVESNARVVVNIAKDVNEITSDSAVKDFTIPTDVDPELLTVTFAGAGKSLFQDLSELFNASAEFAGYEGSFSGSIEYQSVYWEYLMAMSYGRVLRTSVLGEGFGKFDRLGFLDNLHKYCAKTVPNTYANGVSDRFKADRPIDNEADFLSLVLETVYVRCLKVGDFVKSVLNFPPAGIGHTRLHMEILQAVFPSSSDLASRSTGVTGGMEKMLTGHRRLYTLTGESGTYGVSDSFRVLSRTVSRLAETLKDAGFKPGGVVPSLALNYHEPGKEIVKQRLLGLGFTAGEVDRITGVGSFSELLELLAPLTDSDDVISFFRAFDLTKLLYEFGGQPAIDQYINFLYGADSENSLVRLLGFLDVNRTQRSTIAGSKYSKLIGYLISLTYAVDPESLQVFDGFLRRNNADLLEAISTLIQNGERNIIKPASQVSVLSGMISQLVVNDNSGYENQKPVWNKLIERSAGNVGREVAGLYLDREGITPTELYRLLNNPSATSPLGEMLNGVRGGRVASILRYCNLFGLLYSLSDFRNSYQLMNSRAEEYRSVLELILSLDELSQALELGILILDNEVTGAADFSSPLAQVQNKQFDAFTSLVTGGGVDSADIAESPGTGNSRLPNGVRLDNSLEPEEAAVISVNGRELGVFSGEQAEPGSYVRLSQSNLLANGVITQQMGNDNSISSSSTTVVSQPYRYTSSPVYTKPAGLLSVRNKFDPVKSCRKFGGDGLCDQLGYDSAGLCTGTGFNKSLYPETGYGTELPDQTLPVDRPLGRRLTTAREEIVIPAGNSNYPYSQQGLTELARTSILKDSEMLCASLKDPFQYGACITMLKCKKFKPPYRGRYFFEFCPRTLYGGRLAP
jgi:hypothetical protein